MIDKTELLFAEHLDIPPQRVIHEKCVHVLRGTTAELSALRWVAKSRSYHWFQADMSGVGSKLQFIDAVGKAAAFPPSQGRNWDAFEDSLKDLTWLSGRWYMFLLEDCDRFALSSPQDLRSAIEIFVGASDYWWERRVPLNLFLTGADRVFSSDYGDIADRICFHTGATTLK